MIPTDSIERPIYCAQVLETGVLQIYRLSKRNTINLVFSSPNFRLVSLCGPCLQIPSNGHALVWDDSREDIISGQAHVGEEQQKLSVIELKVVSVGDKYSTPHLFVCIHTFLCLTMSKGPLK